MLKALAANWANHPAGVGCNFYAGLIWFQSLRTLAGSQRRKMNECPRNATQLNEMNFVVCAYIFFIFLFVFFCFLFSSSVFSPVFLAFFLLFSRLAGMKSQDRKFQNIGPKTLDFEFTCKKMVAVNTTDQEWRDRNGVLYACQKDTV